MAEKPTEIKDINIREEIARMFLEQYIPELQEEVLRYIAEDMSREEIALQISVIVGRPVGVESGVLRVAGPTNKIIDSLVELYEKTH